MRKLFLILMTCCSPLMAVPPMEDHTQWKFTFSKVEVNTCGEVELVFSATIDENWYMYSTDMDPNLGPTLPEFVFEPHKSYQLIGKIQPIHPKHKYDDVWKGEISIFEHTAEFRQKVKILSNNPVIKGSFSFLHCIVNGDGRCIPVDRDFEFKGLRVTGTPCGSIEAGGKVITEKDTVKTAVTSVQVSESGLTNQNPDTSHSGKAPCEKVNMSKPKIAYTGNSDGVTESLWAFMLLGFFYGLAALLTPCVFPMIPMTITFFTKNSRWGKFQAIMYGVFIMAIYTIAGTTVSVFMGTDFANWISTHWVPNVLFFLIFMVFGFSFLGAFEIVLPNSLVNKVSSQSGKGGLMGVFFMAFTMVLVSFSCTGPLASYVLVQSFGGNYLKPIAGMFSFSLAFAIPFTLFAIFPQWLNSIPKSGGWLNSVKVVLGFIEIALAFKFLSVPDTVYHWGLLDRDVYLAIWIVLAFLLGLYLLGKLKFAHDSNLPYVSVTRAMLAMLTFTFAIWLIPGLFGAPLAALSGYLPPKNTLSLDLNKGEENKLKAKYSDILHFPHGLSGYFDYCEAIEASKKTGKPIFIDFTGHGCVNCRKMEEKVWAKPEVLKKMKEDFIMLALYADERLELPENEWYISPFDQKIKKTVGKQNLDLQVRKFGEVSQPYYIILDGYENMLAPPQEYDSDEQKFISFLNTGLANYKKLHP